MSIYKNHILSRIDAYSKSKLIKRDDSLPTLRNFLLSRYKEVESRQEFIDRCCSGEVRKFGRFQNIHLLSEEERFNEFQRILCEGIEWGEFIVKQFKYSIKMDYCRGNNLEEYITQKGHKLTVGIHQTLFDATKIWFSSLHLETDLFTTTIDFIFKEEKDLVLLNIKYSASASSIKTTNGRLLGLLSKYGDNKFNLWKIETNIQRRLFEKRFKKKISKMFIILIDLKNNLKKIPVVYIKNDELRRVIY